MRIAHVSDLHVVSPVGVQWRSVLFNKRVTGYANMLLHRARVFRRDYLRAVLAAAAHDADQLVVTGDVTNLSLESEYEEAVRMLEDAARTVEVTVVPGNHDVYLPHIQHEGRFAHHFGSFFESEAPALACDVAAGRFPCVKLRGPAAIIALSSAVPRPPFVSAGRLGHEQIDALARILALPEVARRTPVVLVHHDPIDSWSGLEQRRSGLHDAAELRAALGRVPRALVLFGHLHVRRRSALRTATGEVDVVCATGAALDHPSDAVRAGYNVYEIDPDGAIVSVEACVLDEPGRPLRRIALARG